MKALAGLVALLALMTIGGLGVYDYVTGDFGILSSKPADDATEGPACTGHTAAQAPAPSCCDEPTKPDCCATEKSDCCASGKEGTPADKPAACPNCSPTAK
jgi:hypothetical protein